jgi:SAM-dependent methyltransferase
MPNRGLDQLAQAYGPTFRFHDENLGMLSWYVSRMIGRLLERQVRNLVSLGIGHQVASRGLIGALADRLESYTIVEGSSQVISDFQASGSVPPTVHLVNELFEEYTPRHPVDAIEMGFVLEHVADPRAILRRYAQFLRPGGLLVVVVPNARSLHRLLGWHAGLLDDLYRLGEADLQLGHRRYFDLPSITALVAESGLRIERTEGVFLKCLTTAQLESLSLKDEVRRAFFEVGVAYPEIANAIYLETTR